MRGRGSGDETHYDEASGSVGLMILRRIIKTSGVSDYGIV